MGSTVNGRTYTKYLECQVHGYDERSRKILKGKLKGSIRADDADLIRSFIDHKVTIEGSYSDNTAKNAAAYLCMLARNAPPLRELGTSDLTKVLAEFRSALKKNTVRRFLSIVKPFLLYLIDNGYNATLDRSLILAIKPGRMNGSAEGVRKGGEMLTGEELKAMIAAARTSRDRCLLMVMFEGALRPIEVCTLTWKDLTRDEYGFQLNVVKKTGKMRYIRLVASDPYLKKWLNDYPDPITPDGNVFVGLYRNHMTGKHDPISQSLIKRLVYDCAERAGITKDVYPYLMRHSRITQLVADQYPESVVKELGWGSHDTRMLSNYLHLKNSDIDRIVLEKAGIKTEKRGERSLNPPQCPQCGTIARLESRFCEQCGEPLTGSAGEDKKHVSSKLLEILLNLTPEEFQEAQKILHKMK